MFQTLYKLTFLICPFTHTGLPKNFISVWLQFVQGWAHIFHRSPGLLDVIHDFHMEKPKFEFVSNNGAVVSDQGFFILASFYITCPTFIKYK